MLFPEAIKTALASLMLTALPAYAQGLAGINTEVVALRHFSAFGFYGKTVKYYLSPSTRDVTFTINGNQSYRVNIGAAAEEAMKEWHQAMGINFERTDSQSEAQLSVYVRSGQVLQPGKCDESDILGLTTLPSKSDPHTTINYFKTVIQDLLADGTYKANLKDKSDAAVLDLIMKYLSKHEMGHALGLMHPRTSPEEPIDACNHIIQSQNRISPSGASIMTSNFGEYINYLRMSLDRPIAIDNIDISPQERAAAARIARNVCWATSSRASAESNAGANMIPCSNSQTYSILLID